MPGATGYKRKVDVDFKVMSKGKPEQIGNKFVFKRLGLFRKFDFPWVTAKLSN